MNTKDIKKVLDLMIDKDNIRPLIISLHKDAKLIYDKFSLNSLDFYKTINDELREKMVEAIVDKLNNLK